MEQEIKSYFNGSFRNIVLVLIALVLAYIFSPFFVLLLCGGASCGSSFFLADFSPQIGLATGYFFLAPFLLSAIGNQYKYWWLFGSISLGFLFLLKYINLNLEVISLMSGISLIGLFVGLGFLKIKSLIKK